MLALQIVRQRHKMGVKFLLRQFSAVASLPSLSVNLPKLGEPRTFVLSQHLRNLKDLQDSIIAEDPSVQSVDAVNSEGEQIFLCRRAQQNPIPNSFMLCD